MSFKVGDDIQIAKKIGSNYPYGNHETIFLEDKIEWIDCSIDSINNVGDIDILTIINGREINWVIFCTSVHSHLRFKPSNSSILASTELASNCLDCSDPLTYEVQFNHKDGYVCYGCRSTNKWKWGTIK